MEIKDLQPRMGKVDVVVEVSEKQDAREFNKFGKAGRVCNATVKDATGSVKLTLWNEQVDQVNVGDKVHITNGYVNEYQGEMQLTTGKFGKMELVSGDGKSHTASPEHGTKPAPHKAAEKAPVKKQQEEDLEDLDDMGSDEEGDDLFEDEASDSMEDDDPFA